MPLTVTYTTVNTSARATPAMIVAGDVADTEQLTPGGTSTPGTKSATADRPVAVLTTTVDCWVKFGAGTPVAAANDGFRLLAGQTREFWVEAGHKVAVIT